MMKWQTKKLGDICKVEKKQNSSFLPYVCLEDIESNTGKFLGSVEAREVKSNTFSFSSSHVLYGRLRPYLNKVLLPDFDGHCSTEIFPIKPDQTLDRKFLFYWLTSNETVNKINSTCTGARMPRANMNEVIDFEIPLPPIQEQKRIVAILDQAFADIEKIRANTEKNLKNARELFESYLQQVFCQRGEGWETNILKNVCEKITDGTHQTPKYFDSGYIFLSSKNVTSGVIDWDNVKYLDYEQHKALHKRLEPRLNDILLAKNGTTGVAAIVDKEVVFDIYVSLALIRSKGFVLPKFLLYFINSPIAKKQFNKRLKGIGVPNLHLNEIREVIIHYPKSKQTQQDTIFLLDKFNSETRKLEQMYVQKLLELDNLKKSLLHQALTGQLIKNEVSA